ncbi:hypothetical protein H5410_057412 [Solanum commersonii]|uniref:NB-ARC domain-containing protein n=1 Tax=Solanum commersonii TaxID=4109 RepID=A0A9J5WQS3_SOLCO|nr:hypothetical protein H5410_057412 [Solanum commersonii]
MGSGAINVETLSSEVSWALFKRHSLENRDPEEHPEFEEVGRKIANKCKGLPLALKALAGILRCKSEVDEWRDILRSEIWELPSCFNGILPALILSYNDLPAHLKQCFAYCVIYPKDYPFCKDQVIHLWIANGLVQHSRSDPSLFNEGSHMFEQSRHMSYSMGQGGDFEKLKPLSKSEQLRTLLPVSIYNSSISYAIVELPNHLFINLKLLRFLDISRTEIKRSTARNGEVDQLTSPRHYQHFSLEDAIITEQVEEHPCASGSQEAVKANTRAKNHVEKLYLEWSESSADNSQIERDILDELCPHTNIKK